MTDKASSQRAITVHSLDQARAALAAAAALDRPVTLVSAPGAAGYAGVAWFRKVVDLAAADQPGVTVTAVLDCADKPGLVLAALRQGRRRGLAPSGGAGRRCPRPRRYITFQISAPYFWTAVSTFTAMTVADPVASRSLDGAGVCRAPDYALTARKGHWPGN